ncbi:MAG: hypothetical protein JNL48_03305, partial [Acidobacteria bacterium]|nr:hypothetical protein [Acidobacteriota bacterium]
MRHQLTGGPTAVVLAALGAFLALDGARLDADVWRYQRGAVTETLTASVPPDFAAATDVALPHRVYAPNTALWYSANRVLPAGGALIVDADDGAQVFVDGRQLRANSRTFALPAGVAGAHRVVVRVLNNAMAGGLRAVRIAEASAWRAATSPTVQLPAM